MNDDNAYSNVLLTQSGRVYSVYNMNMKNITTLAGKHISRVDELGSFVMRYSDVSTASHTRGAVVAVAAVCTRAPCVPPFFLAHRLKRSFLRVPEGLGGSATL